MGKDNQPKHRQKERSLRRTLAKRQPYERLLIVCEGKKTEPQYLQEIRAAYRLSTTNVQVQPSGFGSDPMSVVHFAEHLFRNGDLARNVPALAFDRLCIVFDRDEHASYHAALARIESLQHSLRNDDGDRPAVDAVVSVPCFEVWLLMHFEDVATPLHRDEAIERLRQHIDGYEKASGGHWQSTKDSLEQAMTRAKQLAALTTAADGAEPFTSMHLLVHRLVHLRDPDN